MKRLRRIRPLHIGGAVLAVVFTSLWLSGLSLAPGPAPLLLVVVGVIAPAAMAFVAVLVIDAATPPGDRDAAARRAERKAIEAPKKRMEVTR